MTFQLTLETLLAFGAPGLLALLAAMVANDDVEAKITGFFTTPNAALGLAILVVVFLLGALVDTIRAALLDPALDWWFRYRNEEKRRSWRGPEREPPGLVELRGDYLSWLTDKNLPVFGFIMERTQAYYRLSANVLVVSLILAGLSTPHILNSAPALLLIMVLMIGGLLRGSIKARRESFWAVGQFSKGEERRCAMDSPVSDRK